MSIRSPCAYESTWKNSSADSVGGINLAHVRLLRWLSVGAMYFMVVFAPMVQTVEVPVLPLLAVALTALFFNLFFVTRLHEATFSREYRLVLELVFDILAWSAFIYFSGGANNPLVSILLPFVAIGAAVLPERQAWGLGLLSLIAYSLLWEFHWDLAISDAQVAERMHLLGMWLTFAVSVGLSVWFITHMTSAVRRRDSELARAREEALQNEWIVSLGVLAAGTAHELSTPLSTLGTLVEEMLDTSEPVQISRDDLELMESQLAVCRRALIRLTRKSGYTRAEETASCAADEWLHSLGNAWQALHPNAEINMVLARELSSLQLVPDLSLEQVLRNLVDNAIAVQTDRVELSACCSKKHLEIWIEDRGPGIQQETLKRIEQGLPHDSEQGLGLGLALTKSAVERYGGRIEISSPECGGAQVKVLLPLKEIRAR
jgi:two-component system sensor histidine kinase RegB